MTARERAIILAQRLQLEEHIPPSFEFQLNSITEILKEAESEAYQRGMEDAAKICIEYQKQDYTNYSRKSFTAEILADQIRAAAKEKK